LKAAKPKKAHPNDCQLAMAGVAKAIMKTTATTIFAARLVLPFFIVLPSP